MRVLCRVNPPSGATRKQISVSRLGTVVVIGITAIGVSEAEDNHGNCLRNLPKDMHRRVRHGAHPASSDCLRAPCE